MQIEKMESIFYDNKYPKTDITKPLAIEFDRRERAVMDWFSHRRGKYEKENNIKLTPDNKYSEKDSQFLRNEFAKNPHPTKDERIEIGEKIGRSEQAIYGQFRDFRSELRNKSSSDS